MIKTAFRLLPLAAAIGFAADALADTKQSQAPVDVYNLSLAELGQVQISIATGNSTPLDKAPATASVIYAAEIEAMGARTLDDVLETVPGLHVALSSLSRLDSVYSIRGIHSGFNSQVLLLLDGVPVQNTLQSGRPTLFRLPVAAIERVEVIRGPGSAIYGADAYAGVINVITKDASSIESTSVGMRTGSFDSRDLWAESATNWRGLGVAFTMAYQETDGDPNRKVNADLQSTLDAILGTHASLAPDSLSTRYKIFDTHLALTGEKLQANLWSWRSINAGVGAGGAQALDPVGRDDSSLWRGDVSYRFYKSDDWENNLRASYTHYDIFTEFRLLPPGAVVPIGSDGNLNFATPAGIVSFPDGLWGNPGFTTSDSQLELVSLFHGWDGHRLRMSVGGRQQKISARETKNFGPGVIDGSAPVVTGSLADVTNTPYIYLPDSSRNLHYLSLQDEWTIFPDLELTSGVRYDDYSDFGSTINPRLALVWSGSEKLTSKLLYGSAFRAPSIAELYFKNNPVSLGNSSLDPEQINTLEASFNYRIQESLQTTLTLFSYQATDMIEFVPDVNATTKTARNATDQNGRGFELEVSWKPSSKLHVTGSYSLQKATDAHTDLVVPQAPGKQIKFNANWELLDHWLVNGQFEWIGDRERAPTDSRKKIADYSLVNLSLHRQHLMQDLDLWLAVRNATNANARSPSTGEIPDDYPLETRSGWLGVTYTFK